MASDTDSSSASKSSYDAKKHKLSKKHKIGKKHKKEKKKKHHKAKKRAKLELKTSMTSPPSSELDVDAFGPTLPPHLQQNQLAAFTPSIIGPVLPAGILIMKRSKTEESTVEQKTDNQNSEDDSFSFGPMPNTVDSNEMTNAQIEREKRALELKIAAMEGRDINMKSEHKLREEWMLELPDVGLREGLASLSNMKRTFYAGKDKPDFSDRSAWTKTPQGQTAGEQATSSKTSVNSLKTQAEIKYQRERDAEQESLAKKHKKKHKRNESLMDLHQKKLKEEKKQKEKELAASGGKMERRPFSREVDLKMNKIDKNQTKQIVDKAKILNSKFSSGKTKYL